MENVKPEEKRVLWGLGMSPCGVVLKLWLMLQGLQLPLFYADTSAASGQESDAWAASALGLGGDGVPADLT